MAEKSFSKKVREAISKHQLTPEVLGLLGVALGIGLTKQEREVLEHLTAAWDGFCKLDPRPTDTMLQDFCDGVHRCQDQLAVRVAQRANPEVWSS